MVQKIKFRFTPSLLGSFDHPQPEIENLAGVILLQRGEALVGAWDETASAFIHPQNQRELAREALTAILTTYPSTDLAICELQVFTCPQSIVAQFDFGDWQDEWLRLTARQ